MNNFTKSEVEKPNLKLVQLLKNQVDQLYSRQQIFSLSLETLELTRRFKDQYLDLENLEDLEPVKLNKFLALTQHLERNLIQELK